MFEAPSLSIVDMIPLHAKYRGNRLALICGDRKATWAEFNAMINRIANSLTTEGLRKGEKVALLSLNSIEAVGVIFGVMRAGGVIVPLSPLLTPPLVLSLIRDSGSRFLFADAYLEGLAAPVLGELEDIPLERRVAIGFANQAWTPLQEFWVGADGHGPGVQLLAEDEANIIYSSGTTGVPKGIVHCHRARFLTALALAVEFRMDSSAVTILTLPLASNAAWAALLPTVALGGVTVMMVRFTPEHLLAAVQRERGSHTLMVPTQIQAVIDHPDVQKFDLSSLRIVVTVGSAMAVAVKRRFLDQLGDRLTELYGLTEGIGTILKPEEMRAKMSSVGAPTMGIDIRIIGDAGQELPVGQIGEIVGRSVGLMKGYHNRPEATAEVVWRDARGQAFLRTGDMGRFDEDGYLYILDRKRDMIISGGANVFASDIEEVLLQHPDVSAATVIAGPHEKWGECPLALIIRKPGAVAAEDQIKEWANARLAKYQRIMAVEFREEFPKNALGKVLKRALREHYWTGART